MPHSVSLITTIAAALGVALVMGFLATRLKLPVLVGYLVAGILIGPATPGFVADIELSRQLAEIGVIEIARALNPSIETVVRAHSDEEAALLRSENAGTVFVGERELAFGMTRHILEHIATPGTLSAGH